MALYQGNILLSGGNNEAPDEIFVAEFNVTTFSEIQSAYNEGKTIFLKHSNALYNMTSYSNSMITFSGFRNNAEFVYRYTVNSSNSWNYEGVPQTPKSHASTHKTGGTDVITPASIGAATLADLEEAVANIPTPDVSGQISAHNADTSAHSDIRSLVSTAQTTANNAASAATAAQTTATNAAAAASASAAEIGDLKITTRTDLGEKWLLCNGAQVSLSDAPGLYDMLPLKMTYYTGTTSAFKLKSCKIFRQGNKFVVFGTDTTSSSFSADIGVCYTSNSINGPWTRTVIADSGGLEDACYYNGRWIVVGYYFSSYGQGSYISRIWTSTDLNTWTELLKLTDYDNYYHVGVRHSNGKWVVIGRGKNSGNIIRTANDTDINSWTTNASTGISDLTPYGLYCHPDGTFVAYGFSGSTSYNGYIAYSTNPAGSWTSKYIDTTSSNTGSDHRYIFRIYYLDNKAIALCANGRFYGASTMSGTWSDCGGFDTNVAIEFVGYHRGKYIASTWNAIYKGDSLSGPWEILVSSGNTTGQIYQIEGAYCDDECILGAGHLYGNYYNCFMNNYRTVPVLSYDESYAYIKAKE